MILFINRNYRRVVLFTLGIAIFGSAVLSDLVVGGPVWLNLVFLVLMTLSSIFVGFYFALRMHRYRRYLELAGTAALVATIYYGLFPVSGTSPIISALFCFVAVLMALKIYLNSDHARRIGAKRTFTMRHSSDLPYKPADIWPHAIPGASGKSGTTYGLFTKYKTDPDDPDTLHVTFWGSRAQYDFVFLDKQEPEYCRFYFLGSEEDRSVVDGITEIGLTELERKRCYVTTREERTGQPLGMAIERWFDNPLRAAHVRLRQSMLAEQITKSDSVPNAGYFLA
ncbi:MAG: hypothetical protein JXR14_08685 [Paracoccaceae bacterium]